MIERVATPSPDLCHDSLTGLSVGDALGDVLSPAVPVPSAAPPDDRPGVARPTASAAGLPPGPWAWTDDTEMACSIVAELRAHGTIDPDRLARAFAERCHPERGYGRGALAVLREIGAGRPWREAAGAAFDGHGSHGNGAAMRVAPLGAYLAGRVSEAEVVREATRSAEVTHTHPDGVAGAVTVALAAYRAGLARLDGVRLDAATLLTQVLEVVPAGSVRDGTAHALRLLTADRAAAVRLLGNGSRSAARDTVPFALWVASTFLSDYPTAIQACVEAGGDVDTTCAIAGGIVATYTGVGNGTGTRGVPRSWLSRREPLPPWSPDR
jgi:ADP-ribosylglycohydrolase